MSHIIEVNGDSIGILLSRNPDGGCQAKFITGDECSFGPNEILRVVHESLNRYISGQVEKYEP